MRLLVWVVFFVLIITSIARGRIRLFIDDALTFAAYERRAGHVGQCVPRPKSDVHDRQTIALLARHSNLAAVPFSGQDL